MYEEKYYNNLMLTEKNLSLEQISSQVLSELQTEHMPTMRLGTVAVHTEFQLSEEPQSCPIHIASDQIPAIAAESDPAKRRQLDTRPNLPISANGDSTSAYLREIGRIPLLTSKDETELALTIRSGKEAAAHLAELQATDTIQSVSPRQLADLKRRISAADIAREKFINANQRLVVSIAKKYQYSHLSLLDLIQEGNIGMMRAVEKFDPDKGFKFSTYAMWWIKQSIIRGIDNTGKAIRIPSHAINAQHAVKTSIRRLEEDLGRKPTIPEIAIDSSYEEADIRRILQFPSDPISLSTPVGEDSTTEFGESIGDTNAIETIEESIDMLGMRLALKTALDKLSPREREIIILRKGLIDGNETTFEAIGHSMGLTRERIRQIEAKAMKKLAEKSFGLSPELYR